MNAAVSTPIHLGIVILPVVIFILAKRNMPSIRSRLTLGAVLAILAGALAFYLAEAHGWRPITRRGNVVEWPPIALAALTTVPLLLVFTVLTFAKKKKEDEPTA